jgi:RNase H-fold protein (predicted Holliday junction resolvase)
VSEGALLGVDPGTAKCGLVVLDGAGAVLDRAVVSLENLPRALEELDGRYAVAQVALGNRTGSGRVEELIRRTLPRVSVARVGEHRSTEEARRLYWQYHPPRGWRRLVPRAMLVPPEPLDAYAAEVLARRARAGDDSP